MNRKIFLSVSAALTGLILYSSCTKIDTTDLGNELIPAVDNVKTFETVLDVQTDNFLYDDSTKITSNLLHALGIIADDPEFGGTEANIYSNFSPGTAATNPFGSVTDSVIIDSVVLSLAYGGYYGDSNTVQHLEVYEIDPAPGNFIDSTYYIHTPDFKVLPSLLGSRDVLFTTLNDSVLYRNGKDTIRTISEMRIKLDTAFARKFVNYDTAVQYKTDSAFRTYFKGLAIKATSAGAVKNGLAYFNLTSTSNTKLTFYTRVTNDGKIDTTTATFAYNSNNQANLVKHTPAHAYQQYLTNGTPNDDKVYIQSTPGSYATIKIPGIDTFAQVNRVIHRAELIIEQVPSIQDNIYTPPALLFLDAVTNVGDSIVTIRNDFTYDNQGGYDISTFGGNYTSGKYVFTLSRYLQSVVTKKQAFYRTMRIYAPVMTDPYIQDTYGVSRASQYQVGVNTTVANGRVVVGGGSHPNQKMRIRIIYSKI
ncbi:DUF4270 domain-containing protein [Paraflavitalea pollutisoli]|uniref:DUF4270 domain-containing protein n=1 Tax=Paraflavitalea pollutisoli TaxID=3034143 RepID=UPI0023EACF0D|nr:DUF4270 domain-containing protein [Paraflavitalea sp. H1-2-19X]